MNGVSTEGEFEIIVHRGHNRTRGENSIAGIQEIQALGESFRIEIDVCLTADDVPILYHDLSFDRLCGVSGIVHETLFDDIPTRMDSEPIPKLVDVLTEFPEQKFLLDLRTHVHEDFLTNSAADRSRIKPTLERIVPATRNLIDDSQNTHLRFVLADFSHYLYVKEAFPKFEIDFAEQYSRQYLNKLSSFNSPSIFGDDAKRMYIRFREISPEIIEWAHNMGLKIIANHAPSRRSLENSKVMLREGLAMGMDGLTASPIDEQFIDIWRRSRLVRKSE